MKREERRRKNVFGRMMDTKSISQRKERMFERRSEEERKREEARGEREERT